MQHRDWFMRAIEGIVEAIGRVMGLVKAGQLDDARRALDEAYSGQLGIPLAMIDRLDAASVVLVLGPERATLLLDLLRAEAALATASGDAALALRIERRSAAIERHVSDRRRSA
ncbi:MAG: hypothetical protein U0169_06445 [Polyangiaceae bacterium]